MRRSICLIIFIFSVAGFSKVDEQKSKTRYKKNEDIDFSALLIEGQLQRPEIGVVTGNVKEGGDGLLRLRENFLDKMAVDYGENIQ